MILDDLKAYMDTITYGWINRKDGTLQIETLNNYKEYYSTLSLEEIEKYKIGTCIEQTFLEHTILNENNVNNKMFCLRNYNDSNQNPIMHCFVLIYEDNQCIHFEHSNPDRRGIHYYKTEDEALNEIIAYYKDKDNGKERNLTEFNDVPYNLTWDEFNNYLNELDNNMEIKFI